MNLTASRSLSVGSFSPSFFRMTSEKYFDASIETLFLYIPAPEDKTTFRAAAGNLSANDTERRNASDPLSGEMPDDVTASLSASKRASARAYVS